MEELRVNFGVPHPAQIGTDNLDVNYAVLNKSLSPIVIEQVVLVQIETVDFSTNPSRNSELCKPIALYTSGRVFSERWLRPTRKVLHLSADKPSLPAAENKPSLPAAEKMFFGNEWEPPFHDDGKLDVAVYDPKTLLLESGKDTTSGRFSVDAGKAISLTASFDTDTAAWDAHNVVVICGAINYIGSDGHAVWAVCPATILAHLYHNREPMGSMGGAVTSQPYTITTGSNEGLCGVLRR